MGQQARKKVVDGGGKWIKIEGLWDACNGKAEVGNQLERGVKGQWRKTRNENNTTPVYYDTMMKLITQYITFKKLTMILKHDKDATSSQTSMRAIFI